MPRGKKKSVKEPKYPITQRDEPAKKEPERVIPKATEPEKPRYSQPKDPKWTLADPKLSKSDKGRRWIAVFRCTNPSGIDSATGKVTVHKTKATNLTPAAEVPCHKCGWPTEMIGMFKNPPVDYRAMRVREPDGVDFEGASDA